MRYIRQRVLKEIGDNGQEALGKSRVLVIGAGGLGSPTLLYLAAAGIGLNTYGGCIGIMDNDAVNLNNLQRQILFTEQDETYNKAIQAAVHLQQLNSECNFKVFDYRLTAENALETFAQFDIIIDGSDNFDTKYLINDAALKLGLPVVFGSILGFEGQAAIFWGKVGACYRCLYPAPPDTYVPNCAEVGTLGGIAGFIGSIQAIETCKLALGLEHCSKHDLTLLLSKLFLVDARNWEIQTLSLEKNPECPACSIPPDSISLHFIAHPYCESSVNPDLTLNELHGLFESGIPFTLLDTRELDEWSQGHIEGAEHIPLGTLLSNNEILERLNHLEPIIVYCQHGIRSKTAVAFLRKHGFDAFNLLVDWSAKKC